MGEFEQRAARLAGALLGHGLGPGSVVACYLYNCPEYFETFLVALKFRAVPANVNYRYVPRLVVFVDEVPRAPNGKIDYAAVRAVLAGRLGMG